MNSLYGRFGMKPDLDITEFITNVDLKNKIQEGKLNSLHDQIKITDEVLLISHSTTESSSVKNSIGIASAVTAYSRVHMSQFKKYLILDYFTLIPIQVFLINLYLMILLVMNLVKLSWNIYSKKLYS